MTRLRVEWQLAEWLFVNRQFVNGQLVNMLLVNMPFDNVHPIETMANGAMAIAQGR